MKGACSGKAQGSGVGGGQGVGADQRHRFKCNTNPPKEPQNLALTRRGGRKARPTELASCKGASFSKPAGGAGEAPV